MQHMSNIHLIPQSIFFFKHPLLWHIPGSSVVKISLGDATTLRHSLFHLRKQSVLWTCTCQWHIHVLKVQPIRLPNCSNLIGGRAIQDFFLYLIPFDKAECSPTMYIMWVTHRSTFKKCSRFFPKTTVCRHWTTAANPMDPTSRSSTSSQVQSSPVAAQI